MKKAFLSSLVCYLLATFLTSCQPGEVSNIYTYRQKSLGFGAYEKCCDLPQGKDCSQVNHYVDFDDGLPWRTYVENDDIAGFFKNEDWQKYFSELVGEEDLVNHIISVNPKAIIEEDVLHLLKDREKGISEENNLFSFFFIPQGKAAPAPCHGSFNQ